MTSQPGRPGPVEPGRFRCTLTIADEPPGGSYARVTIVDAVGETARGCPRHAAAALDAIAGAHVDWTDSRGAERVRAQGSGIAGRTEFPGRPARGGP
jgi:hypothetical protein